jgi:excisionase family DNA binding protein
MAFGSREAEAGEMQELRLDGPLLRAEDAAELLSVRTSWIYEAVRSGVLPCLRVGRHIRFTRGMLEVWLREVRSPGRGEFGR